MVQSGVACPSVLAAPVIGGRSGSPPRLLLHLLPLLLRALPGVPFRSVHSPPSLPASLGVAFFSSPTVVVLFVALDLVCLGCLFSPPPPPFAAPDAQIRGYTLRPRMVQSRVSVHCPPDALVWWAQLLCCLCFPGSSCPGSLRWSSCLFGPLDAPGKGALVLCCLFLARGGCSSPWHQADSPEQSLSFLLCWGSSSGPLNCLLLFSPHLPWPPSPLPAVWCRSLLLFLFAFTDLPLVVAASASSSLRISGLSNPELLASSPVDPAQGFCPPDLPVYGALLHWRCFLPWMVQSRVVCPSVLAAPVLGGRSGSPSPAADSFAASSPS